MNKHRQNYFRVFAVFLFLGWVTFVIAYYYLIHKPWFDELNLAPFIALLNVGLAIALVGLAGGLGRKLLPELSELHPLERISIQAALGLGILSIIILIIGAVGIIATWIAWLSLVLGLVLLWKSILSWFKDWRIISVSSRELNRLSKWAFVFSLTLFGVNLLYALAPPLKWDSLVYHLQVPSQYVNEGRIFFYPENLYAGFPQLAGMLYTWAIALGSVSTAAALAWMVGVVMFLGLEGCARRLFGVQAAWLAPAIMLSGFSISQALSWAYVDLWLMLFGLMMLICLINYRLLKQRSWLIMAGVMLGFAIGTKYTAAVFLVVGATMLLPLWERFSPKPVIRSNNGIKCLLRDWLIFGGIATLLVLPWLVKNTLMTGNPIYPGTLLQMQVDPWQQLFIPVSDPTRSLVNDLLLPLEVTFHGIEGAIVGGKPEYGANIGPLYLALIPGLLVGWGAFRFQQKITLVQLLVAASSIWFIWAISANIAHSLLWPRHYYAVFPGLALLAVGGFEAASSVRLDRISVGRVLSVLVALAFGFSLYAEIIFFVGRNPFPVITGKQTQADYITQELGWYGPTINKVNDLPTGARVLFMWEPRTLYCASVICLPDATLNNWWYLRAAYKDVVNIRDGLCQQDITHVLVNEAGLNTHRGLSTKYDHEDWSAFEGFKDNSLEFVFDTDGIYLLYSIDCSQ